jgi:hypothetical protein
MLTMLLGGLWHGAAWTFVVWGGLHGLFLVLHKVWTRGKKIDRGSPPLTAAGWLAYGAKAMATFHLVCLAWIFFRAPDFSTGWTYFSGLFLNGLGRIDLPLLLCLFSGGLLLLIDVPCWKDDREVPVTRSTPAWLRGAAYAAAIGLISFVGEQDVVPFIYFQF